MGLARFLGRYVAQRLQIGVDLLKRHRVAFERVAFEIELGLIDTCVLHDVRLAGTVR
jgi:hypothetical protein